MDTNLCSKMIVFTVDSLYRYVVSWLKHQEGRLQASVQGHSTPHSRQTQQHSSKLAHSQMALKHLNPKLDFQLSQESQVRDQFVQSNLDSNSNLALFSASNHAVEITNVEELKPSIKSNVVVESVENCPVISSNACCCCLRHDSDNDMDVTVDTNLPVRHCKNQRNSVEHNFSFDNCHCPSCHTCHRCHHHHKSSNGRSAAGGIRDHNHTVSSIHHCCCCCCCCPRRQCVQHNNGSRKTSIPPPSPPPLKLGTGKLYLRCSSIAHDTSSDTDISHQMECLTYEVRHVVFALLRTFPFRAHVPSFQISYYSLTLFLCLLLSIASLLLFPCARYTLWDTQPVHGIPFPNSPC